MFELCVITAGAGVIAAYFTYLCGVAKGHEATSGWELVPQERYTDYLAWCKVKSRMHTGETMFQAFDRLTHDYDQNVSRLEKHLAETVSQNVELEERLYAPVKTANPSETYLESWAGSVTFTDRTA